MAFVGVFVTPAAQGGVAAEDVLLAIDAGAGVVEVVADLIVDALTRVAVRGVLTVDAGAILAVVELADFAPSADSLLL